eukprot:TRINITY_DN5322_c0_g3_i1.p1 TRINITY_DN5322_c0_g3~~TRINITY_DN5322_c0_g3_i1.p1  ORF type:complete len:525 (+),score=147.30 TRINITY_DN5322_c0_g3_i1:70-1644(+)
MEVNDDVQLLGAMLDKKQRGRKRTRSIKSSQPGIPEPTTIDSLKNSNEMFIQSRSYLPGWSTDEGETKHENNNGDKKANGNTNHNNNNDKKQKKKKPQNIPTFKKKPKLSKAERRALQEKQIALKAKKKGIAPPKPTPKKNKNVNNNHNNNRNKKITKQVELFQHLPQFESTDKSLLKTNKNYNEHDIHPEIFKLGLQYSSDKIVGSNARSTALLYALKEVIRDYKCPQNKSLHRDLEPYIRPFIQYLIDCREQAICMGNIINYLKKNIANTSEKTEEEAKEFLLERIDHFIETRIIIPSKVISEFGAGKIVDGDVILTHASSSSVELTLKKAFDDGKEFRVIIVDSRPRKEGKSLLKKLVRHGLECTYVLLNAISYIMSEVTKVFVGANSLLANGQLISRAGTAMIAMMANNASSNIPVLVCCEAYKFTSKAILDSFCFNELGNPDDLIISNQKNNFKTQYLDDQSIKKLNNWRQIDNLKLLHLNYDLTPIEFITGVVTEFGLIPPTSVPVVLRELKQSYEKY